MEYEKLFAGIAVVAVSIFAILSMLNYYNESYGTNVGYTFNNTMNSVALINNITDITNDQASATQNVEGSGTSDPQTNLVERSLRIITILPRLLGLVPDLMEEGAIILGVPPTYVNMAIGVFVFSFTILFAYLLLIGVKRLI